MDSTSLTPLTRLEAIPTKEEPNHYEQLSSRDKHIKTRYVERGSKHGPKGGAEKRIAKRRAKKKAARKAGQK